MTKAVEANPTSYTVTNIRNKNNDVLPASIHALHFIKSVFSTVTERTHSVCPNSIWTDRCQRWTPPSSGRSTSSDTVGRQSYGPQSWTLPGTNICCWIFSQPSYSALSQSSFSSTSLQENSLKCSRYLTDRSQNRAEKDCVCR